MTNALRTLVLGGLVAGAALFSGTSQAAFWCEGHGKDACCFWTGADAPVGTCGKYWCGRDHGKLICAAINPLDEDSQNSQAKEFQNAYESYINNVNVQ